MNEPSAPTPPARSGLVRTWLLRIALFVGLFLGISYWQQRNLLGTDTPAPLFSAQTLDGRSVALSDFQGKPVLLHFWATWCGVCRQEIGMLNRLHQELGSDATLLSVVADSDNPELARFIAEQGIEYPVLLANRALLQHYKVGAFPTNYFIGRDGTIQDRTVGLSTEWAARARLACAR